MYILGWYGVKFPGYYYPYCSSFTGFAGLSPRNVTRSLLFPVPCVLFVHRRTELALCVFVSHPPTVLGYICIALLGSFGPEV